MNTFTEVFFFFFLFVFLINQVVWLRGDRPPNVFRVCVLVGCFRVSKLKLEKSYNYFLKKEALLTWGWKHVKERSRDAEECGMQPPSFIFLKRENHWTTLYMCSCYKIIILGNENGAPFFSGGNQTHTLGEVAEITSKKLFNKLKEWLQRWRHDNSLRTNFQRRQTHTSLFYFLFRVVVFLYI